MEGYLHGVKTYYDTLTKYYIHKKYKTCETCSKKRSFNSKPGKLSITCSDKCPKQLTINLAEYTYYPETKKDVTSFLQSYIDPDNLKDVLHVSKEINELKEKVSATNELYDTSKKAFIKQNHLKDRLELARKTHKERILFKKEQILLLQELRKEGLREDKRKEIMKGYIALQEQCKAGYMKLQESSTHPLNNFLLIKEGSSSLTKYEKEETSEEYTKDKLQHDLYKVISKDNIIGRIIRYFRTKEILTKQDYVDIRKSLDLDYDDKYWLALIPKLQKDITNAHPWLRQEQEVLGSIIYKPITPKPKSIKVTEKWKDMIDTLDIPKQAEA